MKTRSGSCRLPAAFALALLAACGGGGGDKATETASITVVNHSTSAITEVNISPAAAATWGVNQLVAEIPVNGSQLITEIPAGTWDLRAVTADGEIAETYSVVLTAGSTFTWTIVPPPVGSLLVTNNSSLAITELYVALSSAGSWGADRLASTIAPSGAFTLNDLTPGTYDLRAVASDGTTAWESRGIAITDGGTFSWTLQPPPGSLQITNGSSFTITELYVALSSAGSWGADRLASSIAPSATFTLSDLAPGTYDLMAVASDGTTTWETSAVAITTGGTYSWTLQPPQGSLHLTNSSSSTITELYVALSSAGTWGLDQLVTTIAPSGTFTLADIDPGTYDLMAVASDGTTTWERYDVVIASGGTLSWTLLPPPGSLEVTNTSSLAITELYVAPSSAGTWGADQLAGTIAPSGTFTLVDIAPGTYDLMAVASDGTTTWETLDVVINAGGTYSWTLLPPAPTTGDLEITNSSSLTITELYVALSSAGTWGPDQLAGTIAPSGTFTLIDIAPGTYDFQAVASDGTTTWERYDVVITAGEISAWTLLPPAPATGDILVNNDHCVAITELYVAPSSGTSWGVNQLVASVPSGGALTLTGVAAELHDILAAAEDGTTWEAYDVPIPAGGTYALNLLMPAGTACLDVVNTSAFEVGYLYAPMSSDGCTLDLWGTELLGSQTIPAGYTFTLTNVPSGTHDLWADELGGAAFWFDCDVPMPAGAVATWTLTSP